MHGSDATGDTPNDTPPQRALTNLVQRPSETLQRLAQQHAAAVASSGATSTSTISPYAPTEPPYGSPVNPLLLGGVVHPLGHIPLPGAEVHAPMLVTWRSGTSGMTSGGASSAAPVPSHVIASDSGSYTIQTSTPNSLVNASLPPEACPPLPGVVPDASEDVIETLPSPPHPGGTSSPTAEPLIGQTANPEATVVTPAGEVQSKCCCSIS